MKFLSLFVLRTCTHSFGPVCADYGVLILKCVWCFCHHNSDDIRLMSVLWVMSRQQQLATLKLFSYFERVCNHFCVTLIWRHQINRSTHSKHTFVCQLVVVVVVAHFIDGNRPIPFILYGRPVHISFFEMWTVKQNASRSIRAVHVTFSKSKYSLCVFECAFALVPKFVKNNLFFGFLLVIRFSCHLFRNFVFCSSTFRHFSHFVVFELLIYHRSIGCFSLYLPPFKMVIPRIWHYAFRLVQG